MLISGENSRSKRVFAPAGPSLALTWKAPFEPVPQKLELVVQGTTLAPPPWAVVQPAGRAPGATLLKFSANTVVGTGLPVNRVQRSVAAPWSLLRTVRTSSIGVPGTKL